MQTPSLWPSALRTLAQASRSDHAFVHFLRPQDVHSEGSEGVEAILGEFVRGDWGNRNSRMRRGLQLAQGGAVTLLTDWRLFSPEEVASDPFEQEFARKYDLLHYTGCFVPLSNGHMVLSLERGVRHGAYVNGELEAAERFFRLVSSSVRYCQQAQIDVARGLLETISGSTQALAWVGATGYLFAASPAFEALVGKVIDVRAGHVRAIDEDSDDDFRLLIARAGLGVNTPTPVNLGLVDNRKVVARAVPMRGPARDLAGAGDVLLSLVPETKPAIPPSATLSARFGLTPSEVRLALRIAQGESLRSAAVAEQITFETARTRLKVVLQKTSTGRQLELALLVRQIEGGPVECPQ